MTAKLCNPKQPGDCEPGKFNVIVRISAYQVKGDCSVMLVNQTAKQGPGTRLQHVFLGWIVRFIHLGNEWMFERVIGMSAT